MAMQASFSSRLLLIGGSGYFGTVLVQKGKLSDLIGELQVISTLCFYLCQALVKGIEGGETDGESGSADAIAQQIRRMAQEVRQLASARQITVLNANGQSGNLTGLIVPATAVGVAGYAYMWWKGIKLSDLMFFTKRNMMAAVANLTKRLEDITGALSKAKEHLTQRIQGLDNKMDVQKEISKEIQNDVNTISENIQLLDSDLFDLNRIVSGLDGKIDSLEQNQDLANQGIAFLCNFTHKLTMHKVQEVSNILRLIEQALLSCKSLIFLRTCAEKVWSRNSSSIIRYQRMISISQHFFLVTLL
ncbi:hypothetical protein LINPERPRIM_LOCUS31974 [Linum perenne]